MANDSSTASGYAKKRCKGTKNLTNNVAWMTIICFFNTKISLFIRIFARYTTYKTPMTMNQGKTFLWAASFSVASLAVTTGLVSCRSHYQLTGVERTRILIDGRYDATPDAQAAAFLAPYKTKVDSIMSPVVGSIAKYMAAKKPESEISNLLPDILVWGGKAYGESPDLGVYNIGGIRAAFAQGKVTYGDVMEVAPFENKICFLTLTGEKLRELFQQIAQRGGEGVSHSVKLVITPDGQLKSATLNGQEIDPQANYRIATLDYLAQGNDGLLAFKDGKDILSPQTTENNVRFIIMDYFREQDRQGKVVDANIEGRIIIEE